nr:ORF23 Ld-ME53 [Lymantria dispar multiple nucleopolyhedrovirus]WAK98527.1 ORF23 Ld-ME53 [Lymantria dispar multiple nucleopolyhedrovirus]
MMSADAPPRDSRREWLSEENAYLMSAVWRFAKDYFLGVYRINDLFAMNCHQLKNHHDEVARTTCDRCKRRFGDPAHALEGLYCLANNKIVHESESNFHNRFKLICKPCCAKVVDVPTVELRQLYPRLDLDTVEWLARCRFVTRYIFPVETEYTTSVRNVRDETLDIARSFRDILAQKAPNEQIVRIALRTYAQRLFAEELQNVYYDAEAPDELSVAPARSAMLDFRKTHTFINLTYFYEIEKRVYHSVGHAAGYVAYFARPYAPLRSRSACIRCKSRFYKNNPILYCSRCGFMNRIYFKPSQRNELDYPSLVYLQRCVQAVKTASYCIIYYDLNMYKRHKVK